MQHQPFEIWGPERSGRWVVMCDHATNAVPHFVARGDLGLPPEDMRRHIAYDPGAAEVSTKLAALLDAPAALSQFSRLVIDPNRGEDDPTLIMRLYDGTIIPANKTISVSEREARLDRLYRPYHSAAAGLLAARTDPVIVSIHSFTPQLRGRSPRPWHIGVLYADDTRLAYPLIERLRREPDLCIGDNEPYTGRLGGDSMDRHALSHGRPHVLIEIRNDLISTQTDQQAWAAWLAPILQEALAATGL